MSMITHFSHNAYYAKLYMLCLCYRVLTILGGILVSFDLCNPMVLSNAMIFHNSIENQINTYYNNDCYNSPAFYYYENDEIIRKKSEVLEYQRPIPIKDTLNTPLTIENILTGKEYVKIVMGLMESDKTLIVSVLLENPSQSEIAKINLFIDEQIQDVKITNSDIHKVITVFSGHYSSQIEQIILRCKKNCMKHENKIVIQE